MDAADFTLEGLVHDLNNVFHTIRESADLLSSDPKWKKLAATLERTVDRGSRIAGSIVETTRLPADLSAIALGAVEFAQDYLECVHARPVAFSLDIEPGFRLGGNPAAWERVLVNIVLNAAQAGASAVHIRARDGQIRIEDDGSGISPDLLPRIFEPGVSTKSALSGLGLSIVHSLVVKNGGTVVAENRPTGAAFTIRVA